jgi:hypothetical protein
MQWSKAKKLKFLADALVVRVATVDLRCKPQVTPRLPRRMEGKDLLGLRSG